MRVPTIVICGNGASAALLLIALARSPSSLRVVVIGAEGELGQGIAYATRDKSHLLNVPADRMSADAQEPDQFTAWLAARGQAAPGWDAQFVPRASYADYLRQQTGRAICRNPALDVAFLRAGVRSLVRNGASWNVHHSGGTLAADLVVLATGNDMPTPIAPRFPQAAARILDNPWRLGTTLDGPVLILGSALTAVDCVVSLLERGHSAPITLLSRHGLLPQAHVEPSPHSALPAPYPATARELTRALRAAAGQAPRDWQGFMDAMRPHWPDVWAALPVPERRRALRHGATLWNVHRHRLAPAVAARVADGLTRNIHLSKGRLVDLTSGANGLEARISSRDGIRSLTVQWVINCTGPNADPQKTRDPFLENIIASRYARPGAADIGLDVDEQNRVLDGQGEPQGTLFAMAALTRGRWWEITAIPEITHQADAIATAIIARLAQRPEESRFVS